MVQRRDLEDMRIARSYGRIVLACVGVSSVFYAVALARRSYWAIAVPMTMLVGSALAIAGVLGGLLVTTPDEDPDPE